MSDELSDFFRAMKDHRKSQHALWKQKNREAIDKLGFPYKATNGGECLCFREKGCPQVDFYPSTGRWRIVGGSARRGASSFMKWYKRQREAAKNER